MSERVGEPATLDERIAAQTQALGALGFGPAWWAGNNFVSLATCATCGAAVKIDGQAPEKHSIWHEAQGELYEGRG